MHDYLPILASLGALQCLPPGALEPASLARALEALLRFTPRPAALALDGAQRSAEILASLLAQRVREAA